MTTEAKREANRRYLKSLDHITIRLPKGEKAAIKARAELLGMNLNTFITEAIEQSMNFYQEQEDKLPPGKKWCRTPEGKAAIAKLRKTEESEPQDGDK